MSPMWKVEGIDCGTHEVIPPGSEKDGVSGFINKKMRTIVPQTSVQY